MFLVGWESNQGEVHLFTVSPPRTGTVWYYFELTLDWYAGIRVSELARARQNLGSQRLREELGEGTVARFDADRCSRTKGVKYGISPGDYHLRGVILAYPVDWEGIAATPAPLVSRSLTYGEVATGRFAGIFGQLALSVSPPPSQLKVKPGDTLTLSSQATTSQSGATIRSSVVNRLSGKSAATETSLNLGETVRVSTQERMPALLPDQVAPYATSYEVRLCDIDALTDTDEGRNIVKAEIERLVPKAKTVETTVYPTDCMLADLDGGVIEVLGDDPLLRRGHCR
ncbi:MAG: hypothetical protein ABIH46_02425 [Chloroflexota bacterium]